MFYDNDMIIIMGKLFLLLLLTARKNKKLMKIKVQQQQQQQPVAAAAAAAGAEPALVLPMMPRCVAQLVPSMLSVLKAIEPDVLFSGYDGSTPDTSSRLMSTLNRLGGQQVVSAVKWAKSLPGEASRGRCAGNGWRHRGEKVCFKAKCSCYGKKKQLGRLSEVKGHLVNSLFMLPPKLDFNCSTFSGHKGQTCCAVTLAV